MPVPDTTEKFGRKKPPNEAERRALARSFSCARFPPGRAIRYFDGSYSPPRGAQRCRCHEETGSGLWLNEARQGHPRSPSRISNDPEAPAGPWGDLNRSESTRQLACPRLSLPPFANAAIAASRVGS